MLSLPDYEIGFNTHKYYKNQQRLGLNLFSGKYDYRTRIILNDTNVLKYIDRNDIRSNFNFNTNVFFQTPECSNFLYTHIRRDLQNSIIEANPFKFFELNRHGKKGK